MNVGDEHSVSLWMKDAPAIEAPRLTADEQADVVVIGAGIAGLSTAYELSRLGKSVIVIDRGKIARGMTARTTAHLASEIDDYYYELIAVHGEDEARRYHESQVAAINRIEAICRDEGIECDFRRLDGYYIPSEGGVKGNDTIATFTGSPHPVAAQLFINHILDAQNSAANTNLIYYMGPNEAAKQFIDPAILEDPTINPDQAIVDKLQELLALDQSVRDEYLKRWQELRG